MYLAQRLCLINEGFPVKCARLVGHLALLNNHALINNYRT